MTYGDSWQMNDVVMSYRSASSVAWMFGKWCISIPKRSVFCALSVKEVMLRTHTCLRTVPECTRGLCSDGSLPALPPVLCFEVPPPA